MTNPTPEMIAAGAEVLAGSPDIPVEELVAEIWRAMEAARVAGEPEGDVGFV